MKNIIKIRIQQIKQIYSNFIDSLNSIKNKYRRASTLASKKNDELKIEKIKKQLNDL